jgi:hypothetical protein
MPPAGKPAGREFLILNETEWVKKKATATTNYTNYTNFLQEAFILSLRYQEKTPPGVYPFFRRYIHRVRFRLLCNKGKPACRQAGWKNGKREKQEVLWVFSPFSPLSPFPSVLHFLVLPYLLSSRPPPLAGQEFPVEEIS